MVRLLLIHALVFDVELQHIFEKYRLSLLGHQTQFHDNLRMVDRRHFLERQAVKFILRYFAPNMRIFFDAGNIDFVCEIRHSKHLISIRFYVSLYRGLSNNVRDRLLLYGTHFIRLFNSSSKIPSPYE